MLTAVVRGRDRRQATVRVPGSARIGFSIFRIVSAVHTARSSNLCVNIC